METDPNVFAAKQYSQKQERNHQFVYNSTEYPDKQNLTLHECFNYSDTGKKQTIANNFSGITLDEPIDLTTFNNRTDRANFKEPTELNAISPYSYSVYNPTASKPNSYIPQRHKERKLIYTEDDQILMVNIHNDHIASVSCSSEKQFEVLTAAKSLFSKRTRTLYHWLYPNISRQQVKQIVTNSWESLNRVEKEFYISQVLGRFGFSNSNLMINPQLDSIKELADLPTSEESGLHRIICDKTKKINSLMGRFSNLNKPSSRSSREFGTHGKKSKSHRNRRQIQKLRRNNNHADFTDDPELSFELEKFALNFKLSKI